MEENSNIQDTKATNTKIDTANQISNSSNEKELITNNSNEGDLRWLYGMKDYNLENLYELDKHGNIISKIELLKFKTYLKEAGLTLEDIKDEKIKEIIKTVRTEIDFIKKQEKLKEIIKGYPEFNEPFFQVFNANETLVRFSNEKNALRSLIASAHNTILRLLLSICHLKKEELYKNMINDNVLPKSINSYTNYLERKVFIYITNCMIKYNHLPTLKSVVNMLEIPYSEEFFNEYLYTEEELEQQVTAKYHQVKKAYYKSICKDLDEGKISIESASKKLTIVNSTFIPPNDEDTFSKLEENLEKRNQEAKFSTGIKELDDKNVFLSKGKVTTVFAYTGSFKTMFCTNVAYNIIKNGGNVLYISLEVSKDDMYINFLSRHSYEFDKKISHSDIKANRLNNEEQEYLFKTVYPDFSTNLKDRLIVYDETNISSNSYYEFDKLLAKANKEFQSKTKKDIDLIIIDHLNLLKFGTENKVMNDYAAVNHWMSYLRKSCINFLNQKKQVAMLCACQSSREGYKKALADGKYQLTSIAEGNEIERCSQIVLSLFTTESMKKENKAFLQILKMRDEEIKEGSEIYIEPKYYTFGVDNIEKPKNEDREIIDDSEYVNDLSSFDD